MFSCVFSIFSISSITPMTSIPVGVLCSQWCLAAGRSNQYCFSSLDLLPQLSCKLAVAKCLLLYIGLLVKYMWLVVRGNICLGGFYCSPYRFSAYRWSDITFAAQSGVFTYVMDLLLSCFNLICEQSRSFPFSQHGNRLSCHMFFWSGASMFCRAHALQHSGGITTWLLLQI